MSLPAILISIYFALGLLFAFVVMVSDRKKGGLDSSGSLYVPVLFWLFLLLWPVMALFRFTNSQEEKRKEPRRDVDVASHKDKKI